MLFFYDNNKVDEQHSISILLFSQDSRTLLRDCYITVYPTMLQPWMHVYTWTCVTGENQVYTTNYRGSTTCTKMMEIGCPIAVYICVAKEPLWDITSWCSASSLNFTWNYVHDGAMRRINCMCGSHDPVVMVTIWTRVRKPEPRSQQVLQSDLATSCTSGNSFLFAQRSPAPERKRFVSDKKSTMFSQTSRYPWRSRADLCLSSGTSATVLWLVPGSRLAHLCWLRQFCQKWSRLRWRRWWWCDTIAGTATASKSHVACSGVSSLW